MILAGKTVVVCVTGGIACYKACGIVSALKKLGATVNVVMTENAREFVSPLTFETLAQSNVVVNTFDKHTFEVEHISLAKKADAFLIAPCTANVVGKLAAGIADDFLTTTVMATKAPVIIAPAMNTGMLTSAAYTANEEVLKRRGFIFISPDEGKLACGDSGKGRLADEQVIVDKVVSMIMPKRDFEGKTVLVTLGGTREHIDPVRYISNNSSGKMGNAIVRAALNRGARVIAVCGYRSVEVDGRATVVEAESTQSMFEAVQRVRDSADYFIMAAAPCDYRVSEKSNTKIKSEELTLDFVKNVDIAVEIGKTRGASMVIFAAETENLIENATTKLKKKNAAMVVANDITKDGAGFFTDTNIATLISNSFELSLPKMSKDELAEIILDKITDVCKSNS